MGEGKQEDIVSMEGWVQVERKNSKIGKRALSLGHDLHWPLPALWQVLNLHTLYDLERMVYVRTRMTMIVHTSDEKGKSDENENPSLR